MFDSYVATLMLAGGLLLVAYSGVLIFVTFLSASRYRRSKRWILRTLTGCAGILDIGLLFAVLGALQLLLDRNVLSESSAPLVNQVLRYTVFIAAIIWVSLSVTLAVILIGGWQQSRRISPPTIRGKTHEKD